MGPNFETGGASGSHQQDFETGDHHFETGHDYFETGGASGSQQHNQGEGVP